MMNKKSNKPITTEPPNNNDKPKLSLNELTNIAANMPTETPETTEPSETDKKITITNNNSKYQLALCGQDQCQPPQGISKTMNNGTDINGNINLGKYTLIEFAAELQNSLNFFTKKASGITDEFSVSYGNDRNNYETYQKLKIVNNQGRAFTFKSINDSFYTKVPVPNKLLLSNIDDLWSWGTGIYTINIL